MKFFSSFDTRYKQQTLEKKRLKYWEDRVHVLKRSKFFLYKKWILPLLLIIASAIILYLLLNQLTIRPLRNIIITIVFCVTAILYYNIIGNIIDYKMDYCIITPDEIIYSDQTGLFKRQIRTLDAMKIKSISVKKGHIINSIFNNGIIVFMSDGDDILWEIIMEYIYNPEKHKLRINTIIDR